jgi:hypothetical protein
MGRLIGKFRGDRGMLPDPASILCALLLCASTSAQNLDRPSGISAPENIAEDNIAEIASPPDPVVALPQPEPVSKRLFGIIPNYRADQIQAVYQPITTREKYRIARSDSFDWPNYFLLAGYALQSQVASGGFSHNGGVAGFGEFYARSVGDQIIGSYVTEAILPSLLHEDPRYFRMGSGTFWHRVTYATSRILITRTDNGKPSFNISEVVGNAGVVALTTLYYPDSRSAEEAAERYGMALGNDAISNLLTEFWPDIKRHLHLRPHHTP